jgi:hypothetical protein
MRELRESSLVLDLQGDPFDTGAMNTIGQNGREVSQSNSIAPYVSPESHKAQRRVGRCAAKNDTCGGFHTKTSPYCAGHERSLGVT